MSEPGQTVAITGSTGFVGSHLVRSLSNDGYRITAFGRSNNPPQALLQYGRYLQWDITESADGRLAGTADVFVHAAGFVDFWGKKHDIYRANVVGTQHAVELAKGMGAKTFMYISSASVYDPLADNINIDESAPYAERYLNYYAETKVEAERLLRKSADFDSLIIIRPHAVYGPGDRTVVPQILNRVRHHRFILPDKGDTRYSVTHVANIVDVVRSLIKRPLRGVTVLNITDAEPVGAREFLGEVLGRLDGGIRILTVPYPVGLAAGHALETCAKLVGARSAPLLTVNIMHQLHHESTMSIDLAKKSIGYTARYSHHDGLDDTFEWISSLGGVDELKNQGSHLSWSGKIASY